MACTVSMKSHLTIWYLIDLLNFSLLSLMGSFAVPKMVLQMHSALNAQRTECQNVQFVPSS